MARALQWLAALLGVVAAAPAQRDDVWGSRPVPSSLGLPFDEVRPSLDALVRHIEATEATQRTPDEAAWQLLALSAHGSSLRSGAHKATCRTLIEWLRRTAAIRQMPRSEQLMVALALQRAAIDARYPQLREQAEPICRQAIARFRGAGAPAPTPAEAAMLLVLSDGMHLRLRLSRLDALDSVRTAVELVPEGADHLADAVRAEITRRDRELPQPDEAPWPGNWPGSRPGSARPRQPLHDWPLHSWFAAYLARQHTADARRRQWRYVQPLLPARAADGLWPCHDAASRWRHAAMLLGVIGMSHGVPDFEPHLR